MQNKKFNRGRAAKRLQHWLMRMHQPRLQMSLIILLTAGAGFFSSALLRYAGVVSMWQRYPIAVACAYLAFLFLLWCWLHWRKEDLNGNLDGPHSGSRGSVDQCAPDARAEKIGEIELPDVGGAIDGGDELVLVLLALAAVFSILFVAMWTVWTAPVLFAEILVDAALARGLYRTLAGFDEPNWLRTALRRTGWQFLFVAVFLAISGGVMQHFVPSATSFWEVLKW